MKNHLHFEILINAPVQKVWAIMLDDKTYRKWTVAFEPTSYFEGSWEKGEKIKFLSQGGSGMYSEIAENIPNKYISIRHLGMLDKGVVDTSSELAKNWKDAYENYTFDQIDHQTLLKVDLEADDSALTKEMTEMFKDMWPKALLELKNICEAQE
jgi:uncharacterized protein YndB with AHSA1/START domain